MRASIAGGDGRWPDAATAISAFTSPTPTEAELVSFYAGSYHQELRSEGGSEEAFGGKYERYLAMLGRHLGAGRVLDVGCSTGLLVRMLVDRGYQAEGVELNPASAQWGAKHYGVRIYNRPLESCPIRDGSLDAVFLTDVLEHTRHPVEFLREVGRRLAAGGFVVVTLPDISSVESLYQQAISRCLRRAWLWRSCHIPLHVWEFTPKTASACFAAAGFRIAEYRRSQPETERVREGLLGLLEWPLRVLRSRWIAARLGTQMEFVIQKGSETAENSRRGSTAGAVVVRTRWAGARLERARAA